MINTCQIRKKGTYSSFTKYCFQKRLLPKEIEKSIPRSTRHTWHKQCVSETENNLLAEFERESLDYACIFTEKENLKTISGALTEIILLYHKIIGADNAKLLLIKGKHHVLETIDRLKNVFSVTQLCAYLGISTHQYHSWKNNKNCQASLLKLCRKKFPAQLTSENVKVIKAYMDNTEFQFLSRATIYWKIIREGKAIFSKAVFYKYCRLLDYHKRPGLKK